MYFVYFILAAVLTVYTAIKLSKYADVISEKTTLGGMLVGTLLLAGATSLPEVTTSLSAVVIGNIDITIGNMLGSNLFNLLIIASFDLYFRKRKLFLLGSRNNVYSAGLGLLLMLIVLVSLIIRDESTILGLGIDALLVLIVYGVGIFLISRMSAVPNPAQAESSPVTEKKPEEQSSLTAKQAIFRFVIAAFIIMAAGTLLSVSGDRIAVITGLGSSFVGSFLIAAATSLPEAVSIYAALKLKNVNLALGSILGSNMFNMLILAGSDVVYRGGSILADVSRSHLITSIGVSVLSLILIIAFARKESKSSWSYSLPSALIFLGYFLISYLIFIN